MSAYQEMCRDIVVLLLLYFGGSTLFTTTGILLLSLVSTISVCLLIFRVSPSTKNHLGPLYFSTSRGPPLLFWSFFIADFVSIVLSCRTSSQKSKAGPSTPSTAAHRPLTHTHRVLEHILCRRKISIYFSYFLIRVNSTMTSPSAL